MTNCTIDNCINSAIWSGKEYIRDLPDDKEYTRDYICEVHQEQYEIAHPDYLLIPIALVIFGEVGTVTISPVKTRPYTQKVIVNE